MYMLQLFLCGDFNCTENVLDRNHQEPHAASWACLIKLVETYELCDIWRLFYKRQRQYTWVHTKDSRLSLARLDWFYCFKHPANVLNGCSIVPVGISDHSLVQCSVFIKDVKCSSAYWHFNVALLSHNAFTNAFKFFFGTTTEKQRLSTVQCNSGGM